jgi:hypothetical protein
MTSSPPPDTGGAIKRLVGLMLMVIGIFWLVMTGLCSGAFLIGLLGEGNLNDAGGVLMIGIPSALIGGVLYSIGRWLAPRQRP